MNGEELSPEDRRRLLVVARRAIEARLSGRPIPREEVGPGLRQRRGAFVTLRRRGGGDLRGCIGLLEAAYPLVDAVASAAVAAATADGRFDPVTVEELPSLTLEISALGPAHPISADEVEVGTHGLILRYAGRSGLLLPQVATDHGWDEETFLDQTCRKAGLPPGTWRRPGVELLAFTATVFREEEE